MANLTDILKLDSQESYFSVSPKLIDIANVLVGSKVSITEIDQINKGVINLLRGLVILKNFKNGTSDLEQVSIQTELGKIFTFVNNENLVSVNNIFTFDVSLFELLGNTYLINEPVIIPIRNLNSFKEEIIDASNYNQPIACIYNRITEKIRTLQVISTLIEVPILETESATQKVDPDSSDHISLPIEINFLGQFTQNQRAAFRLAATRWGSILRGTLITNNGRKLEGINITATSIAIDGPYKRLAQAGPQELYPDSLLPATGIMEFDTADLERMENDGSLLTIITHEMAHALGFGTLWEDKGLLQGVGTDNPTFIGANAMREYADLLGVKEPVPVPLENMGASGTQYDHWRESIFGYELMTGFIGQAPNPLSRITVASLQDLGYSCNFDLADMFKLPNAFELTMMDISHNYEDHKCCSKCSHAREARLSVL